MRIPDRIKAWEHTEGVALFREIGVCDGSVVVDFGFGHGHFAVAAAQAAGSTGKVIAIDSSPAAADSLRKRLEAESIGNIDVVLAGGGTTIGLPDGTADFVLYYDILHMPALNRQELLAEAHRVLRTGGVLSVLPFHMDEAGREALSAEIIAAGFGEPKQITDAGLHFGMLYTTYQKDEGAEFDAVPRGAVYQYTRR